MMGGFLSPFLLVYKAAGSILATATGSSVWGVLALIGADTPIVIGASVASAVGVLLFMRRLSKSIVDGARESVDGLRVENQSLRAQNRELQDTITAMLKGGIAPKE